MVKATPEDERAGRGWDGPATVIAFAADRSFAPNDGSVEAAELFEVNTQGPRVAIIGVSPGSNPKDDPFWPEFENGEFTRSRISVRYTANDPNLEGTVYLKIYPGQFQGITREQFDANNPYPIRVLDPISTGALERVATAFAKRSPSNGTAGMLSATSSGQVPTPWWAADTVVPAAGENEAAQVRPFNTVSFNGNIGPQEYVWSAVSDADGNPLLSGLYLVKVTVFDEAGAPAFRIGRLVVVR